MGRVKSGILEKIKETSEVGKEGIEAGEKLEGDGSEIKSLMNGIDTSMDEDDVSGVQQAESGYSADFKAAFKENVDTKEADMERLGTEASDTSSEELDKVNDAASKFDEMAGVTDVGRSNAEGAADQMRNSAREYEDFISEATSIVEDTKGDIANLRSSVESIFG